MRYINEKKKELRNKATNYKTIKSSLQTRTSDVFLHREYELISHSKVDPITDKVIRLSEPGALMGIGIT